MQIKEVVLHLLSGLNQYIENTGTLSSSMSLMHTKWDVLVHLQQEKRSIFVCCCFDERCRRHSPSLYLLGRHWVKEKKRKRERRWKSCFLWAPNEAFKRLSCQLSWERGGDLNRRTKLPGGVHTVLPAYSWHPWELGQERIALCLYYEMCRYINKFLDTECQFRRIALYCPSTP